MDRDEGSGYYARRAAQARASAERAGSNAVRNIHLDMADRYARLADRDAPDRRCP